MLPARRAAWEMSDMADTDDLRGPALYDALMRLKPDGLPETEWASQAGVNRGFFTNLKAAPISPRSDTLRKLLKHVGRTEAQLYAVAIGKPFEVESVVVADQPRTRDASEGETVSITSLDLSYSMGPGTNIDGYIEENPVEMDIGFLRRITRSEFTRLRIARGVGDSMYPTLLTSDVVLIDTTQNTLSQQDRVYAISLYGASAIKRLRRIGDGKVLIVSDNPSVGDQEVELADVKIDGRVIWFGRDL